ncbi:MAG TPA: glycosyltransferase, partial [Ignavibacteria bacterium]|nr:glycosyltransferase [Ignavibacteria bacterium]
MKVIHIEDRFHPDMGYQINYFAEYHNQNTEFHILSSKSFSLWKGINKDKIILYNDKNFERKFNVKITRLDSFNSKDEKYNIWLKDLFQTIDKISPDIVYTHALETLTSIRIILSKLNRKVLIVSDTHTLMNQQNKGLKSKVFDIFLHNIYVPAINRKNIIVFYTADENKKILLDIYGIKKTNVFPSLIGTNLKDYRFDEIAREKIRQKLNIDFNSPLILYTGKLNNKKRPHLLLEAVKEIEDSLMQKIHLVFVGPQDQEYMQRNFNIKFSDKVKIYLVGSVLNKELFKYYSAADFVVFPKENTLSA